MCILFLLHFFFLSSASFLRNKPSNSVLIIAESTKTREPSGVQFQPAWVGNVRKYTALHIIKTQGKYKGRQPIAIDWVKFGQLYDMWKSQVITAVEFQKRMNLRANTFYRRLKEYEHGQK